MFEFFLQSYNNNPFKKMELSTSVTIYSLKSSKTFGKIPSLTFCFRSVTDPSLPSFFSIFDFITLYNAPVIISTATRGLHSTINIQYIMVVINCELYRMTVSPCTDLWGTSQHTHIKLWSTKTTAARTIKTNKPSKSYCLLFVCYSLQLPLQAACHC